MDLCRQNGVKAYEKEFSLYDVYAAKEAFVTGTFGGVTPVSEIDGRKIGNSLYDNWADRDNDFVVGPMTRQIQAWYNDMIIQECGGL